MDNGIGGWSDSCKSRGDCEGKIVVSGLPVDEETSTGSLPLNRISNDDGTSEEGNITVRS